MNISTVVKTVGYLVLISAPLAIAAPLKQTTPTKDFIDNKDGTVTHKKTKLTWQRCAVGQTWTGTTCLGDANRYTWDEAIALKSDFAGKTDWRLPAINELNTIIEYATYNPAINSKVFPNTPRMRFWSSSSVAYSSNFAWVVSFRHGYGNWVDKDNSHFVRLVR